MNNDRRMFLWEFPWWMRFGLARRLPAWLRPVFRVTRREWVMRDEEPEWEPEEEEA